MSRGVMRLAAIGGVVLAGGVTFGAVPATAGEGGTQVEGCVATNPPTKAPGPLTTCKYTATVNGGIAGGPDGSITVTIVRVTAGGTPIPPPPNSPPGTQPTCPQPAPDPTKNETAVSETYNPTTNTCSKTTTYTYHAAPPSPNIGVIIAKDVVTASADQVGSGVAVGNPCPAPSPTGTC
jgi:hypothetical protein